MFLQKPQQTPLVLFRVIGKHLRRQPEGGNFVQAGIVERPGIGIVAYAEHDAGRRIGPALQDIMNRTEIGSAPGGEHGNTNRPIGGIFGQLRHRILEESRTGCFSTRQTYHSGMKKKEEGLSGKSGEAF